MKSWQAMGLISLIILIVIAGGSVDPSLGVVTETLMPIVGAVHAVAQIRESRHGWVYGAYLTFLVFSIACVTYLWRKTHELHLHHFFNCAILIPFTGHIPSFTSLMVVLAMR